MKKHIPNIITLLNLFCGSIAIPLLQMSQLDVVFYLIAICLIADVLDGFLARWLKVSSPLGVQLDSLADMISFGLLPGVVMFFILQRYGTGDIFVGWSIIAFLIPVSAGYRLAKFNVDTRERTYFYGLPTPAGAMVTFGLLWMIDFPENTISAFLSHPYFLYGIILALVILFHAPIELPSLKGKTAAKIIIGAIALLGIILFVVNPSLAVIIPALLYILVGFIHKVKPIY